jgi:HK97 family phage major capsid protein
MNNRIKAGPQFRSQILDRAQVDEAARTTVIAFASEEPYERSWGVEVLNVDSASMRLGRLQAGGPLLVDHDPRDIVGVIEDVSVGPDRVARAKVRFGRSARAEEVFRDVADGIRTNSSFGYRIHEMERVRETDGVPSYRVTDFEPFEVSIVSVPADPTVGVGRAVGGGDEQEITIRGDEPHKEPTMEHISPQPAAPAQPAPVIDVAAIQAAERTRVADIYAIGRRWSVDDAIVQRAVADNVPADAFGRHVLVEMGKRSPAPAAGGAPEVGMEPQDIRRYSLMRAVLAAATGDWSKAGLELEAHRAIEKRLGPSKRTNSFYVPYEVQSRDLTAASATQGSKLVGTDHLAGSFIELLRARTLMAGLGARMLPGLVGNVAIPKQTGAGTAYWLANEATAITESDQTIGQVTLTPKQVGAYTEISKQLVQQSAPGVEQIVTDDLAAVVARAIDLAGFEGTGAPQPTGISGTAGIGSVTGTSLAYAGVLEFQTDLAGANALVPGCAYVTTPAVAALLSARARFSNTDTPLWSGSVLDGQMAGFRATTTTALTAATMVFGDFSQVIIGMWGDMELEVNPYANFPAGIIGVRAWATVDIGIRQAGAFSRATSIT